MRAARMASLLVAFCAVACGREKSDPVVSRVDVKGVVPAETAAPITPDAAPPSRIFDYQVSLASFKKDILSECIEIEASVLPPADAGIGWQPKEDPTIAVTKEMKGSTRLKKKCAEQFADRLVLASCRLDPTVADGGAAGTGAVAMVEYFYDLDEVLTTDTFMSECLEMGGSWVAVDRNSEAFTRAKMQHDADQLRKRLGRL